MTMISYEPAISRSAVISFHKDTNTDERKGHLQNPEIVTFCNCTKGEVDISGQGVVLAVWAEEPGDANLQYFFVS